nr:darcynin family protein [uncultured Dyadobacter sp.]
MKQLILIALTALSLAGNAQTNQKSMESSTPFTILVLMNAHAKWLALSREKRSDFFEKEIVPLFQRVSQTVVVRLYDSEYFHASVSDFMIIEAKNLSDYQDLIERLRDTKIYGAPYFEIRDIIVGQQNRFQDFNQKLKPEQR